MLGNAGVKIMFQYLVLLLSMPLCVCTSVASAAGLKS